MVAKIRAAGYRQDDPPDGKTRSLISDRSALDISVNKTMRSLELFCRLLFALSFCSCTAQTTDSIVLINVGHSDMREIAEQIDAINNLNPAVLAIDIAFTGYNGTKEDVHLANALKKTKKLILPSKIASHGQDYYGKEMITVYPACDFAFEPMHSTSGFVSAEVSVSDADRIPGQFMLWQTTYEVDTFYHFSLMTAMAFDSLAAMSFLRNHDRFVPVDYQHGGQKFPTFSAEDVLGGKVKQEQVEGKIVMIGFLGPGNEDKHFSPLTDDPTRPDMYGLEYLAHIVAQILEYE